MKTYMKEFEKIERGYFVVEANSREEADELINFFDKKVKTVSLDSSSTAFGEVRLVSDYVKNILKSKGLVDL